MSTPQQVACIRGFGRQWCNIGDVRDIGERAGHGWVGSQTLPLAKARLGSQILAVARKRIRFQALSNTPAGVGGAGNCGSYGSRVRF